MDSSIGGFIFPCLVSSSLTLLQRMLMMAKCKMETSKGRWIWLSHALDATTPVYGGTPGLENISDKSIDRGDSCNTALLYLPNHLGSHVDAPLHFSNDGRSITDYTPEDWIFYQPLMVNINAAESELLSVERFEKALAGKLIKKTDLLLIHTGFSRFRSENQFWEYGPGLAIELASWLHQHSPGLRAIGVDCISISCLQHREKGHMIHRALLGNGIRIFEDLALDHIEHGETLNRVIALPLQIKNGDGAPCSMVGHVECHANNV